MYGFWKELRRLSLHIRPILDTKTAHNNQKQKQENKTKRADPEEGKESNFQTYHTIRFKCPVFNQKYHKTYKETEGMTHSKGKSKLRETVSEKDLMADLLGKFFKTAI